MEEDGAKDRNMSDLRICWHHKDCKKRFCVKLFNLKKKTRVFYGFHSNTRKRQHYFEQS